MAAAPARNWFGQPPGLTILFLTETWEKFSFYGMRAILVYYMVKQLGFDPAKASLVYGAYTAGVYFTPIVGGAISDRWLGRRRAVILGGTIMALGHFLMAFPALFFPALATIAIGNGFFLPNLPSQIDSLFTRSDPRRGSAYNVYYVGVNLGAFLAPLVCGTLGEVYGWHYGFGAAGVGMLIGLSIYIAGQRWLSVEGPRHVPEQRAATGNGIAPGLVPMMIGIIAAVVVFRGAYEQLGNSIALWVDTGVDRTAFGFLVPGSWFQSLNPLLVLMLTPLIVARWTRAADQSREPSPLRKMALGAAGLALAYLLLVAVMALSAMLHARPHWLWLMAFIAMLTAAELYILPVGLGLFARLAPAAHRATTIAAWFFAAFAGNFLAGLLGALMEPLGAPLFFAGLAGVAGVSALLLWRLDAPVQALEGRMARASLA